MFNNSFAHKKVLVTGHTGFKGSWLSRWLMEPGANVCGISIDVPTNPSHLGTLGLASQLKDVRIDINNGRELCAATKNYAPDIVFIWQHSQL